MRTRLLAALGGVAVLGVGAAIAAPTQALPTPFVGVSTLTTRNPDSLGLNITYTRRCRSSITGSTCPRAWEVTVVRRSFDGWGTESSHIRSTLRDTVLFVKPDCGMASAAIVDTMLVSVRALGTTIDQRSDSAGAKLVVRCRALRADERAELLALEDSFPAANRRLATSDYVYKEPPDLRARMEQDEYRAATSALVRDTIRARYAASAALPDSQLLIRPNGKVYLPPGFSAYSCKLARNKYTRVVMLFDGDVARCETPRLRMEREASG